VSEQKRPLLFPQEVKELGKNREILFYESVRPILACKNRYYRDPLFRKRLFPPPKSAVPRRQPAKRPVEAQRPPTPNPSASPANEIVEGSVARAEPLKPESPAREEAVIESPPPPESMPATREAVLADIDRIESLTLEDYAVDLGHLKVPEGPLSTEETKRLAEGFVQAFHER
jgi:type IV secretion system protein VirD4